MATQMASASNVPAMNRNGTSSANGKGKPDTDNRPQYEKISNGLRAIIVLTIMSATLLEVLDTSIVNVALPDMMGNLGATLDQIGWVSTGYIISNVVVLPLTGWLSDYFGRRRYLAYSVILFTLASFLCGTSRTLTELVLWRVVQGAGGAAFLSTAQATLVEIFPPAKRGMAQGIFGIGVIMAPTLGPTLGGYITDTYSWPWIFFVNVPIGIVACILTFLYVPDSSAAGLRRRADFVGIGFLTIGLASLQTVLERGERDDWFQANYIVALTVTALVGMGLFIWWELRPNNKNPAVNLRILKNGNLALGCLLGAVLGVAIYGGNFALPQFWQNVQRHTATQAGLLLFPGGLATGMCMPIIGVLVGKVDSRALIGFGLSMFTISMWLFSEKIMIDTPDQTFWIPLIVRGIAFGFMYVPISTTAFGTLPPRQVADGAGLFNLFRQLGGSIGIAALSTLLDRRQHFHYSRLAEHLSVGNPVAQQYLSRMQNVFQMKGLPPDMARAAAYKTLGYRVSTQAAVLSYIDIFWILIWVGVGSVVLVAFLRKPKNKAGAAAAH